MHFLPFIILLILALWIGALMMTFFGGMNLTIALIILPVLAIILLLVGFRR